MPQPVPRLPALRGLSKRLRARRQPAAHGALRAAGLRSLCLAPALWACSCAGPARAPAATPLPAQLLAPCPTSAPGEAAAEADGASVFVDLFIVKLSAQSTRDLSHAVAADLVDAPDVSLIASPHLIATPGVPASIDIGTASKEGASTNGPRLLGTHVAVKAQPGEGGKVRLDFDATLDVPRGAGEAGSTFEQRRVAFRDGIYLQAGEPHVVAEASPNAAGGEKFAAIVVAHTVRGPDDLRRLMQCRQFGAPPAPPAPPPT